MRHCLSMLTVLLGAAVLLPFTARAQAGIIEGTVYDALGQPLPGVNVVVLPVGEPPNQPLLGAATEPDGRYRIAAVPPGTYRLRASAVGYAQAVQEVTLARGATATVDFVLDEVTLEAEGVVVTAARRPQALSRAPASLSVISAQELEARNVVSLDDALRYVPGVQLAEEEINIRGSSGFSYNTGSRVLLLIDGIPFLTPDRNGVPFEALPMTQVAQIEVLKGSGSALYGSGALGGVVNIITRDYPEQPETTIRVFGGAYTPVRHSEWRAAWADADALRPFGGVVFAHARRFGPRFGSWVHVAWRDDVGYTNFGAERDVDAYLKVGWRPRPAMRLDVLTGATRRTADAFLYWNGTNDPLNPGELTLGRVTATGTNDNLTHQFSVMPSFSHVVGARWSYTLKARLFGASIQPLEDDGTAKPVSAGTIGFRYGGEGQLTWSPGVGTLTAGATADALATESSFFGDDGTDDKTRSQPEGAVFAQWEHALRELLDVTAGLRYDFYYIDDATVERKLSPKFTLAVPLSEATTLRATYGQGFRVPGLAERFVNNRDFLPIVSNLDLLPETSTSYEVGLRSGFEAPRLGAFSVDVAAFWNQYRRLIEAKFITLQEAFQFVNLTRARVRGVETVLEAAGFTDRLRLQLAHTFLDADDLTEEEPRPLVYRSRHLVQAALTAQVAAFELGVDYRFASEPERIDTDFAIFVPDAAETVPTHVVDARLAYERAPFRVAFLVDNLLDYYYIERPAILAPPRHATLQLQVTW